MTSEQEKIKTLMTNEVASVGYGDKISQAKRLMEEHRCHHIPVVANDKPIGMVSANDILRVSFSTLFLPDSKSADYQLDEAASIQDIMSRELVTLNEEQTIREAAQSLMSGPYNSLLITNQEGELKGIVTTKDLMRHMVESYYKPQPPKSADE